VTRRRLAETERRSVGAGEWAASATTIAHRLQGPWFTGRVRARLGICVSIAALVLPAAPAAADSVRLERAAAGGESGFRVVYAGDARSNNVEIGLARNQDTSDPDPPAPDKVIGFLVTGASAGGSGCEPGASEDTWVCRVPEGAPFLAPRAYGRAGDDGVYVAVPRPNAIVYGGPGNDTLGGPESADGSRALRSELHGGDGNDEFDGGGLLYGGRGNDDLSNVALPSRVYAGPGDDQISGSDGADVLNAGPGRDDVLGWGGNDLIRTRDGEVDSVVCDTGRDSLIGDGRDVTDFPLVDGGPFTDCERLLRSGEPLLTPVYFQIWEYEPYVTILFACPADGPRECAGTVTLRRRGRVIDRRGFRERAGNWGLVEYRFGIRRIRQLLDKDIRITMRWRDRTGLMRALSTTSQIQEISQGDDN
jgi:hypothetical protein